MATDWERLGGEDAVRAHVHAFVYRIAADWVIGFFFEGRDLDRIVQHELEHASRHLGGHLSYAGVPLARMHGPLRINRGHFRRRLAIVRTVLTERGIPQDIVARWVDSDRRFEEAVVDGTDCVIADDHATPPRREG